MEAKAVADLEDGQGPMTAMTVSVEEAVVVAGAEAVTAITAPR